ncbi:MAG: hypothetical protein HZB99_04735 [Candidatus Harrisonbacteria bacterium]|nr:hypothetical protein [Candidatus Harrisonbacteria bacterium]
MGRPDLGLSLFVSMNFSNRVLKGRIAETIVSEMLQEAGYFVYRFGYEGILQSLVQKGLPKMKSGSIVAEKIRTMPDFIVMAKSSEVFFVEVKYRTSQEIDQALKDWLQKANKYWPEAKLLLIHPSQPHFLISTIKDLVRTEKFYALERDKFLKVDKKLITSYTELVKKYLI